MGFSLVRRRITFRKMKLSNKRNRMQSDKRLVRNLQKKFGTDAMLIFGDWSAANVKYHEPIKGKDLKRMLQKGGFQVLLLNEYIASSLCPECKSSPLEKFKNIRNPRLYRKQTIFMIKCHELLRQYSSL
ncbi:hypothetical protein AB4K20DRAFT_1877894 [Rhizopus microsporus]|uniref:Uncharacterized protein n=1 Tax=Rhizopus microsporus TaxID=58291 RepID=A0A1X0S7G6_RHIZD|nr:hypothetical protein BCV71DRAFT_91606 [Rhizopus microsporus]